MVALNPKIMTTIGSLNKSSVADSIKGADTSQLLKAGAAGGAAIGLGNAVYDDVDDDVLTGGSKMAVTAGLGAVGAVGAKEGMKHISTRIDAANAKELVKQTDKKIQDVNTGANRLEADAESSKVATQQDKNTKITVGDVTEQQVKAKHEANDLKQKAADQKWKDDKEAKMRKWKGRGGIAAVAGLGAFALASVLDTGEALEDKKEVSRMTEQQERNLNRKEGKQKRKQNEKSYGHVDMGEIAFEMFENRLGHHKMGNAKFE